MPMVWRPCQFFFASGRSPTPARSGERACTRLALLSLCYGPVSAACGRGEHRGATAALSQPALSRPGCSRTCAIALVQCRAAALAQSVLARVSSQGPRSPAILGSCAWSAVTCCTACAAPRRSRRSALSHDLDILGRLSGPASRAPRHAAWPSRHFAPSHATEATDRSAPGCVLRMGSFLQTWYLVRTAS